jgi:hypothetical protein
MQSQIVFEFLSRHQLLVPFVKDNNVLADLPKEDLLVLIEKLLNPSSPLDFISDVMENVSKDTEAIVPTADTVETVVEQNNDVVVNNEYRTKTIKLSLQETYDRLVNEGITSRYAYGKQIVNQIATVLGLVDKYYPYNHQAAYRPTLKGMALGISQKNAQAVWYTLEAYDVIKDYLLKK